MSEARETFVLFDADGHPYGTSSGMFTFDSQDDAVRAAKDAAHYWKWSLCRPQGRPTHRGSPQERVVKSAEYPKVVAGPFKLTDLKVPE